MAKRYVDPVHQCEATDCTDADTRAVYCCFRWLCRFHRGTERCCPKCSTLLAHCSCHGTGCKVCALANLDGFEPALEVEVAS